MGVMVRHKMQQLDKGITAEVTAALQSHQTWQETETEPLGPLAAAAYAWPILNKTYFLWLPSLPGCHETLKNLIKGDILNYIVQINGKKTYRTGRLFIHLCTDLSLSFLLFKMGIKIAPASGNCHEVLKKTVHSANTYSTMTRYWSKFFTNVHTFNPHISILQLQ